MHKIKAILSTISDKSQNFLKQKFIEMKATKKAFAPLAQFSSLKKRVAELNRKLVYTRW